MSAKSRLTVAKKTEIERSLMREASSQHIEVARQRPERKQQGYKRQSYLGEVLSRRLGKMYLLGVALPGYLVARYILQNVFPYQIAHVVIPYSFIPLQIALMWGNFWTLAWIFLNSKKGVRSALLISCVLALYLQSVHLTTAAIVGIAAAYLGIEYMFERIQKKLPK